MGSVTSGRCSMNNSLFCKLINQRTAMKSGVSPVFLVWHLSQDKHIVNEKSHVIKVFGSNKKKLLGYLAFLALYSFLNHQSTQPEWGALQLSITGVSANGTHSSALAWKIPWMEEPGGLQSMRSLRATSLSLFTFMHWRGKWHPTPVLLPGKSHGWRSLVGCSPWGH